MLLLYLFPCFAPGDEGGDVRASVLSDRKDDLPAGDSPLDRLSSDLSADDVCLERKPKVSRIISSSSSVTWFAAPRALCSANLDFRRSTDRGSPVDVRNIVNLRERLRRRGKSCHRRREYIEQTHSGRITDARKSLAGGSSGSRSASASGA